jgi:alkaline phosphatase D
MRFVQISDTHLSQDKPHFSDNWAQLAAWIANQHPDLVIHTGDMTFDGARVEVDLSYAARLMDELGIRWWGGARHHDEVDAVALARWITASRTEVAGSR